MAFSDPERLVLTVTQQAAYDAAMEALNQPTDFLAPVAKIVSTDRKIPSDDDDVVTIVTPGKGHHDLYRKLEQLDGLDKEELKLIQKSALTTQLTQLITTETYTDSRQAIHSIEVLGDTVPRRVCQHPFKRNDIVWVCRTCQADETCVLCHACFSASDHEGHDVAFYHAQAGGCCDCGDPDGTFSWTNNSPLQLGIPPAFVRGTGPVPLMDRDLLPCRQIS